MIRVDVDSCDLQGFAAAGFATWTDEHSDLYDAKRAFVDPGSRIEKGPGSLRDKVHFGRARYGWNGKNFIVYTTMFTENWLHGPLKAMFILAPCGDKVVDNHHVDIDALLLACGNWTKELHGEIFVFDQARWSKSKELYKSVESSSWDDVILNPDTKSKLIEDIQGFFENRELYRSFGIPWKRGVSKYRSCPFLFPSLLLPRLTHLVSGRAFCHPVDERIVLMTCFSSPWCSWKRENHIHQGTNPQLVATRGRACTKSLCEVTGPLPRAQVQHSIDLLHVCIPLSPELLNSTA